MDLAQILVRLGITGDKAVVDGVKKVDEAVKKSGKSAVGAGIAFRSMDMPLVSLASSAMAAQASLGMLAASMSAVMSLNLAAHYQRTEMALSNLIGSAARAKSVFSDLRDLWRGAGVNALDVSGMNRVFMNSEDPRLSASQKSSDMMNFNKAVMGATISQGLGAQDANEFGTKLGMIRSAPHMRPNTLEPLLNVINVQAVAESAFGRNFKDSKSAMQALEGVGDPKKMVDLILKGMINKYPITAATSFSVVLSQIGLTLQEIMIPSANVLITVLGPVARVMLAAADAVKMLNKYTGGAAGLTMMLMALIRAKTLLIGTVRMAKVKIDELTAAIARLGVTSGAAAGGTTAAAAATAASRSGAQSAATASGTSAAATGLKNIIPWLKRIPAGIRNLPGVIAQEGGVVPFLKALAPEIGQGIKGIFTFLKKDTLPGIIAWLSSIALGWLGDKAGGKAGNVLKGVGEGVGWGSMGFLLGPEVGIPTAIIGGIIGGIKGFFSKEDNPEREIANNTQKMSQQLQEMNSHLVGGGRRGQRAASDLQIEMALQRALGPGVV